MAGNVENVLDPALQNRLQKFNPIQRSRTDPRNLTQSIAPEPTPEIKPNPALQSLSVGNS